MSEQILIGKRRDTGKWEIIVDPSAQSDKHTAAYGKIAQGHPVNDTYSRVLCGRIQNTSSPLSLVTSAENKKRADLLAANVDVAKNAGKSADQRQKTIDDQQSEKVKAAHKKLLDEKNAETNRMRLATGQSAFSKTETEEAQEELHRQLAENVSTPAAPKSAREIADQSKAIASKSHADLLAEKNALTKKIQEQASADLSLKSGTVEAPAGEQAAPKGNGKKSPKETSEAPAGEQAGEK